MSLISPSSMPETPPSAGRRGWRRGRAATTERGGRGWCHPEWTSAGRLRPRRALRLWPETLQVGPNVSHNENQFFNRRGLRSGLMFQRRDCIIVGFSFSRSVNIIPHNVKCDIKNRNEILIVKKIDVQCHWHLQCNSFNNLPYQVEKSFLSSFLWIFLWKSDWLEMRMCLVFFRS